MNSLHPSTTTAHLLNSNAAPGGQAASAAVIPIPVSLFSEDVVFTVIGQVQHWCLGWAGRIECELRLPIGELVLHANRDTLPLEIGNGSWIRVKLMLRPDDSSAMHVLSAVALAQPAPHSIEHDQSLVTLASLLWGIGKVSELTDVRSAPVAAPQPAEATCAKQVFSLAWAGGFIDGEGCISIVRQAYKHGRKPSMRLVCSITQNNREVLEHLRDGMGVGGRIYNVKRRSFHTKPVFVLNYDGKKAMAFIALLTPHLIRKRAEALTAWTYWVEGRVGARFGRNGMPPELRAIRERLYLKMRSLK